MLRFWRHSITIGLLTSLIATHSFVQAADLVSDQKIAEVKAFMSQVFPEVNIDHVLPTPSPEIFVAVDGVQMVYVDPVHRLVFMGSVIDVDHHRDLTVYHRRQMMAGIMKQADLSGALKEVNGRGTHRLYVFEDPYCKYCRQLIHQLDQLKDVTIYTFITPILKESSYEMAHNILCHPQPLQTWKNWMERYEEPKPAKETNDCMVDVLKKNLALAHQLGIASVPTLILSSGEVISGVLPAADIQAHLAESTQE